MGALDIDSAGNIIGYGTEIGAFVRLDDLKPGYAFGHLDRAIIQDTPGHFRLGNARPRRSCHDITQPVLC